jgi:uncharacterized RDD family membrane protein YckC
MQNNINPYQPPTSDLEVTPTTNDFTDASKARRFGTLVVDYFGYMIVSIIYGLILGLLEQTGIQLIEKIPSFLLGILIVLPYYIFFEGIWARTPGKLIFGTVVITELGTKPPIGQIIKRTLCRLIPFEAFSFLGSGRGWHDSISKTRVVRAQT